MNNVLETRAKISKDVYSKCGKAFVVSAGHSLEVILGRKQWKFKIMMLSKNKRSLEIIDKNICFTS